MTAEVALFNRSAVALAADSATTITYWDQGKQIERFFKGANKIFHISEREPIGLMIYDAASMQGLPWETIAKAYRESSIGRVRNALEEYAKDFFDYIVNDGHLFPREYQERQLISGLADTFFRVCNVMNPSKEDGEKLSADKRSALIKKKLADFKPFIEKAPFISEVDQEFVNKHAEPVYEQVLKNVSEVFVFKNIKDDADPKEIFHVAATALFKRDWTTLQKTGLVFAGFGKNQYFPHLSHYICYGVLCGKLLCEEQGDQVRINHENVSEIKDFAQSEMVKTFVYGASVSALNHIDSVFVKAVDGLIDEITKAGHLDAGVDAEPFKQAAKRQFTDDTALHLADAHTVPLRNVIGMLAVDELAELAETLISIESLKERVTRPTASVSGPIDVAVISKTDGFIWIKRKHYFDPKINPRFFARKGLTREHTNG